MLRLAETLAVLRQIGTASELACPVCTDDPHQCRVVRTPAGHYQIRCLENGWSCVSPDDVALMALDRQSLLAALAHATGDRTHNVRMFAGDRLVRLGFIARPSRADGWMMAYADGIENENALAGVVDALASQFPSGPGLVTTPSVLPRNLPLPNNYRLISLHELLFGRERELVIDHNAAEARLGRRKKTTGRPGRRSEKETARQVWLAAQQGDEWPKGRSAQVDVILGRWPSEGPTPARGTIENHIREFEQEAHTERD